MLACASGKSERNEEENGVAKFNSEVGVRTAAAGTLTSKT